jgi:cell fate regulator YaaT (PSP1 superfamily)
LSHLVEVAFKGNRKEFFLWDYPDPPPLNSAVIVDVDRGEDLGYVHALGELAQKRNGGCSHGCGTSLPERKALRLATEKDRNLSRELSALNEDARRKAMERVRANNLGMKLSDAEWQWDRKKLTLYFTADKRVDFRNLVRDLASLFRTRIELKQIGVRDEAKRLDGIGRCGRQYCSASWLPELRPVNLGVAKDQRLSLNPSQISGACGRLMCCLRYEHEFYVQSRKRFPKEGKIVATSIGEEKVVSIDIFHESVTLRNVEGDTRTITLADFRSETESVSGVVAAAVAEEEENGTDTITPEEISPELMYTAEHQIPPRNNVVPELTRTETAINGNSGLRDGDGAGRRRRGRRGGRRGRGGDDSSSGSA